MVSFTNFTTESQERARTLMGKNYLGIEEALEFGCDPRLSELSQHAEVPAHLLTAIENDSRLREDCLLAIVLPISEDRLREHAMSGEYDHDHQIFRGFMGQGPGKRSRTSPWRLVRKLVVPGSVLTTTEVHTVTRCSLIRKQLSGCPRAHEICTAWLQSYTQLFYSFVTGEKLQPGILAHTLPAWLDDADMPFYVNVSCGWIGGTFKFMAYEDKPPIGLATEWTGKERENLD